MLNGVFPRMLPTGNVGVDAPTTAVVGPPRIVFRSGVYRVPVTVDPIRLALAEGSINTVAQATMAAVQNRRFIVPPDIEDVDL
jgi:hypothetical protein